MEVAKKAHPDKLVGMTEEEKTYKERLFKKAQAAAAEEDLMELVDVAARLGVDPPEPDESHVVLLKEGIKKIRKKIKEMKSTASWEWYHASDTDKKAMMMSYITTLFIV